MERKEKGMEYIHKLPFMLGAFMAIVIGLISYSYHVSQREIYSRIAICMVVFYIIGLFARGMITAIMNELQKKKEEEQKRQVEMERQAEEEQREKDAVAQSASTLDLKVDERFDDNFNFEEEFAPLTVREILRSGNDN